MSINSDYKNIIHNIGYILPHHNTGFILLNFSSVYALLELNNDVRVRALEEMFPQFTKLLVKVLSMDLDERDTFSSETIKDLCAISKVREPLH